MARFRIRLKLQGLELEVDGERQDIPAITAAVKQQFAGLVQPAEAMADGRKQIEAGTQVVNAEVVKPQAKSSRRRSMKPAGDGAPTQVIDFKHDPSKYGSPLQKWSVTDKCVWLLFVLEGVGGPKEVSGPQLAATFNHQFKASGRVHPPHVSRDLNKAKVQNPTNIGGDKGVWYLTDEGKKYAQQLIQGVLNPA
jgi:hypothetical protein